MSLHAGRMARLFLVLGCLVAAGCGGRSPSEPPDPFVGTWTGTLSDNIHGVGVLTLVIRGAQQLSPGPNRSGTWTVTYGSGPATTGATSPYIMRDGRLQIAFGCPPGAGAFDLLPSGNQLAGSVFTIDCAVISGGTVGLVKQ